MSRIDGFSQSSRFVVALFIMFSSATIFLIPRVTAVESSPTDAAIRIVYTEKPAGDVEAAYLRTLANVLGSEKAARESMAYVYRVPPGFAAKLTPEQAALLSKQPGVLQIVLPSQKAQHLQSTSLQ